MQQSIETFRLWGKATRVIEDLNFLDGSTKRIEYYREPSIEMEGLHMINIDLIHAGVTFGEMIQHFDCDPETIIESDVFRHGESIAKSSYPILVPTYKTSVLNRDSIPYIEVIDEEEYAFFFELEADFSELGDVANSRMRVREFDDFEPEEQDMQSAIVSQNLS